MYTGSNPSALRSKEWLRQALLQLLEHKKYSDITVREICNHAQLSRQTFYQMFDSKEEVMAYHFQVLFAEFSTNCDAFQHMLLAELTYQFFAFFYQQRQVIQGLIDNNMTYLLEQYFEQYLCQIDLFRTINDQEKFPDYSLAFMAGALTQTLIHWFHSGFEPSAREVGYLVENLITGKVVLLRDVCEVNQYVSDR